MKKELQGITESICTEHFGYRDHLLDPVECALDQSYHLGPHQSTIRHLYPFIDSYNITYD